MEILLMQKLWLSIFTLILTQRMLKTLIFFKLSANVLRVKLQLAMPSEWVLMVCCGNRLVIDALYL